MVIQLYYNWRAWNSYQIIEKRIGTTGNRRKNQPHSDYSIVENGEYTQETPGDSKRLAVTQTTVQTHKLSLL